MDTNLPISQMDPLGAGHFTGVGDAYLPFLGPRPTLQRTDAYEKRNVAIWDLPEQYKGRNLVLRDTVEELMFTANQTYLTKYILLWYPTDEVNMQWEQFESNAHLLDLTPYQTTSHAVTSKRSIRRANLVRRGIMVEFEADFMKTAMGRITFLAALGQITRSVQETVNADGIVTLAAGHRYQQQFWREAGIPSEQLLKMYLEQDRERFAIVQKTKNGLEKLDAEMKKDMYKIGADQTAEYALLIPEEIAIFTTLARNEKTDYYLAGQLGPDRVNNVPGGVIAKDNTMGSLDRLEPLHMVRNTPVFIVKNLKVENVSDQESQQLTRVRQIGEYVTLLDDITDYSDYRTNHRSTLMYNEDIDDMTKITLQDCIENCGLWEEESGALRPLNFDGSSATSRRDLDDDFLTYLTPGPDGKTRRAPVEFMFDIAKEYLSIKKIVGAGETLLNSVRQRFGNVDRINTLMTQRNDEPLVYNSDAFQAIGRAITQIIGTDAVFGDKIGEDLFKWLSDKNYGVVVAVDEAEFDKRPGVFVASAIDNAFVKAISHMVPATKKDEIQHILDSEEHTLQKGEKLREKVLEYVKTKVPGVKFKDEQAVHTWYDDRVNQYKGLKQNETGSAASSRSADVKIAGYMPRGLDLSNTQYRYLYPESARVATSHVEGLLPIHEAICKANAAAREGSSSSYENIQSGGQGMGLAGIGQFYSNTQESRRNANAGFNLNRYASLEVHLAELDRSGASNLVKFFSRAWLMTRVTRQNLMSLADHDVAIGLNFLIARPHMQYRTRGIIKCAQHGKTGVTPIGHSDLSIGHETNRKLAQIHYTTHFRSIITQPKNVYVQPDVYVQECEGGAGCRFYNESTYGAMNNDELNNSLICMAVPVTETIFPSPLDISGRFYTDFGTGAVPRLNQERLHYSTAARYNALYNFLKSNKVGSDVPQMSAGRNHINRICYQGKEDSLIFLIF